MNDAATTTTVDFRTVFAALVERIEAAYGLKVNAVFILVHLFGHTVQWNLDEQLRKLGLANSGVHVDDLPRIYEYERQASQLGLALLEEVGESSLARWLSDCFGADWKFLAHFYRTGEKVRFDREQGADEPLLSPLPIPKFTPQRWPPRGSF